MITVLLWYACAKNGLEPTGWLYILTVFTDLVIIGNLGRGL